MERRATFTICLLIILAFSWSATCVHASSVNYAIHGGKVTVELSLQFFQNVTAMPSVSQTFSGAASQSLSSAIEGSLRNEARSASVSSLSGDLKSTGNWINTTIRFDISGVSTQNGSLLNLNCSWIRFKVANDLKLGDLSYNLIGATYIKPTFEKYADFQIAPLNATVSGVVYRLDTLDVTPEVAAQKAGNATLLDFSYVSPPVEEWKMSFNLTQASTTWTYAPVPAVAMQMAVTPKVGAAFHLDASYSYNATLSVDGFAHAHADTIVTEVSSGYEPLLMLAVVVSTFVVAVVTSWMYRSRRSQLPRRRK
jgi:hypothetical protein